MSDDLVSRLAAATVGSCTCLTKTPDVKYHDPECHYRLFVESMVAITSFIKE